LQGKAVAHLKISQGGKLDIDIGNISIGYQILAKIDRLKCQFAGKNGNIGIGGRYTMVQIYIGIKFSKIST
jgi:hypothetical protein